MHARLARDCRCCTQSPLGCAPSLPHSPPSLGCGCRAAAPPRASLRLCFQTRDRRDLGLDPTSFLTFTWKNENDVPKAALKATNASGYYIAYKVKTTKPKRYVVRPPQGIVLPEQGAEIMLTMVPGDANALWHEANERARLSGTPHRPPVVGRFCGGVCLPVSVFLGGVNSVPFSSPPYFTTPTITNRRPTHRPTHYSGGPPVRRQVPRANGAGVGGVLRKGAQGPG